MKKIKSYKSKVYIKNFENIYENGKITVIKFGDIETEKQKFH